AMPCRYIRQDAHHVLDAPDYFRSETSKGANRIRVLPEPDVEIRRCIDEWLAPERRRFDPIVVRERVAARQCEHHGLALDDESLEIRWIPFGGPGKSKVEVFAEDGAYLLNRNHRPQDYLDSWIGALEAADHFVDQTAKRHHSHETDLDPAGFPPGRLPRDGYGFFRLTQYISGALQKAQPGIGE